MDRVKEKKLWTILIILLLTWRVMGGASVKTATALALPILFVDPSKSTGMPDESFTINITVNSITSEKSLYGWEVEITFNPSVVTAVKAEEGPFLKTAGTTYWIPPVINNTKGSVHIGAMLLPPFPSKGAVGSGTLANITFKVKAQGATPLHFAIHELYTVIMGENVPIEHTPVDGFFSNVHDIAITNLTASPTDAVKPEPISINVTVANQGDFPEIFNVTAYSDSAPIKTWNDITLEPKANTTLTFTWNTTYVSTGTYTLKAEASIVLGETDTTDNMYVDGTVTLRTPPMAPKANFTYSPKKPIVGETVTFNASASTPDSGHIVSYLWDFGDGTVEIYMINNLTTTATHVYTTGKTYTVRLTVENNETLKDSVETTIKVIDYPVAIFTYLPENPIIYESVTFNASESHDNRDGGWIVSYRWDFDYDGVTFDVEATGKIVTHAYTQGGLYNVALRVTDNDALTDTATDYVTVLIHDIAITDIAVSQSRVDVGESVLINVTVANEGNFSETFMVTIYFDNNIIEEKSVTNLPPGSSKTLTITWNIANVSKGEYTIKAVASTVEGEKETHADDNIYIDGTVTVTEKPAWESTFIYPAVAVTVVIIIAAILIYFLKVKKPKTP